VAVVIREQARADDLAARLGGDEFALLLPGADAAGAVAVLARLREALLRRAATRGWPVTFSLGAATFPRPPADVDGLVRYADGLMYRVKRGDKDRLLHETVTAPAGTAMHERRASARLLCGRAARVSTGGEAGAREWTGTVRDISAGGSACAWTAVCPIAPS
jgi:predicted signal transduction protein with EAL and GGDEF domain